MEEYRKTETAELDCENRSSAGIESNRGLVLESRGGVRAAAFVTEVDHVKQITDGLNAISKALFGLGVILTVGWLLIGGC